MQTLTSPRRRLVGVFAAILAAVLAAVLAACANAPVGPGSRPALVSTSPSNGTSGVSRDAEVTLTFSKEILPASLQVEVTSAGRRRTGRCWRRRSSGPQAKL